MLLAGFEKVKLTHGLLVIVEITLFLSEFKFYIIA